jgi:hypothetical protein
MGFYFRSDHYEFARVGVPSLETSPGVHYVGKPARFGEMKRAGYIANDYHNASDVIKPDWDLLGAVEDLQILLEVGYRVAQQPDRPTWKPDAVCARGLRGNLCRHESPPARQHLPVLKAPGTDNSRVVAKGISINSPSNLSMRTMPHCGGRSRNRYMADDR